MALWLPPAKISMGALSQSLWDLLSPSLSTQLIAPYSVA